MSAICTVSSGSEPGYRTSPTSPTSSLCRTSIGEEDPGKDGEGWKRARREGGVDFRATGRLRKAIMSAWGCLGCKLLPVQIAARERREDWGWGEKWGEGSEGCKGKCPLSWVMFDAALLLASYARKSERKQS